MQLPQKQRDANQSVSTTRHTYYLSMTTSRELDHLFLTTTRENHSQASSCLQYRKLFDLVACTGARSRRVTSRVTYHDVR